MTINVITKRCELKTLAETDMFCDEEGMYEVLPDMKESALRREIRVRRVGRFADNGELIFRVSGDITSWDDDVEVTRVTIKKTM